MNIAKDQHVFEAIFAPSFISALAVECLRIFECAKEHVPNWDVREVVRVMTELMMNPMRFRALENKADPGGRFDIPMLEELPEGDENGVIATGMFFTE
jgi:hypothetical protein